MAAAVVGRRSEGHAGCQLNGCFVRHRKLKVIPGEALGSLERQNTQQHWRVKSWASSVVYIYMFVCLCTCKMPQCNDDHSKVFHQCAVAAGSRWRGSSSPGHMPIAWVRSWQCPTPTTPSSRRTFLCHCGRAGGSGRAGMLPSHYWTERDSMRRHRWDKSLTKAWQPSNFLSLINFRVLHKNDNTWVSRQCLDQADWSCATQWASHHLTF